MIHVIQPVGRKRAVDARLERLHARFLGLHHHGTQRRLQLLLPGPLQGVQPLLSLYLQRVGGWLPIGWVQGAQGWRGGRKPAVVPRVRRRPFAGLVAALVLMFVPPPPAPPRHGEEAIKQGVEQGEITLRLDQHRAQAEAQRLAVVQADMADALQGFEALGHGHAQPLLAQQAHEGEKAGGHRFTSCNTRAMSSLSLSRMLRVSTSSWRDSTSAPSTTRANAQSSVSLMLGVLRS